MAVRRSKRRLERLERLERFFTRVEVIIKNLCMTITFLLVPALLVYLVWFIIHFDFQKCIVAVASLPAILYVNKMMR